MDSLAGRVFGRFYLLEEIGLGGMATVYKGLDLDNDQKVAVKILAPVMARSAQLKARFEREIKLLRTLRHPNIVPILSFGEEDGHSYIVMPFYTNGTLQDRLSKGTLTPREGARLMNQVSAALAYAHRQGIVHRDVKPSNVLLDDEGNAMLSDFGFAQVQDASLSLTGSALIGTPAYMSPEQCTGGPVDARSDQYSLGVILYQVATGKLPFEADTPMGLVIKHVNAPLTPPRLVSPNLPEGVEAVLVKALAKDPARRFATVAEMSRALQRSVAQAFDSQGRLRPNRTPLPLPVTQPMSDPAPVTPTPAPVRWYRRRAWALASILLLLALPTAALAFSNGTLSDWLGGGRTADATPDLVRTISALSTQISNESSALSAGQVSTAVVQTMTAAGAFDEAAIQSSLGITESPDGTSAATLTSTGLRTLGTTRAGTPLRTPTRTGAGGPNSDSTRTATQSATPTDAFSDTPGPSPTRTLMPTETLVPTPTRTAVPTDTTAPSATRTKTPTRTPRPTHTPADTTAPPPSPTSPPPPSATNTPPPPATNTPPPPATNTSPPPATSTSGPQPTPTPKKCNPGHPCTATPTPG